MWTTSPHRSAGPDHAVGQQDPGLAASRMISAPPPQHVSTLEGAKLHSAAAGDGTERMNRVPGTLSPSPQPRGECKITHTPDIHHVRRKQRPCVQTTLSPHAASMHATASEVKPQNGIRMLPNEWLVGKDPHRPRSTVHLLVSLHTPLPDFS
jgi:hypothetical protein